MDAYLLRFERLEILATVSEGVRPDNDWLLLHWFSGSHPEPPRIMPLRNATGSTLLVAGDMIPPFSCACELPCADPLPVFLAFLIVELGAYPPAEQPRRANAANRKVADLLAEAYVEANEWVAESRGIVRADAAAIDTALSQGIVDSIAPAFVEEARTRLARDGWSGTGGRPVLHDVVAFSPAPKASRLTLERAYPDDGHGSAGARVALRLVLEQCDRLSPSLPASRVPLV
ncbi:hypothetical protein [Marilutibacter alkalisoli]|uniref:Uncharacterized protein n=1 Tax=Marilutibacter alkalisoli TaxID=2591633 RepID=A0A514BVI5_9GAMM|nr:hypothetical protein [Lysobacter alkalisoli]QDH71413.1 hypothetical protein FKV23_15920 [Lysobacter alkalisoli]